MKKIPILKNLDEIGWDKIVNEKFQKMFVARRRPPGSQ